MEEQRIATGMKHRTILLLAVLSSILTLTNEQSLIESILTFLNEGSGQAALEPKDTPVLLPEYDFIVVGAGTAGSTVTNRLTENPNWSVLLLEAGGSENYIMDIPLLVHYLQTTEANWKYKTQPSDKYCLGMEGLQCKWPRGKVLGGSSVLNYMIYTRGNRRDYDNWARMGNDGWSYSDVLPYFKKVESIAIPEYQKSEYHNTNGYLTVSYPPYRSELAQAIVESAKQYGMNYVDYNGANQTGVSYLQTSTKDGVRDSSSRAYLHPIRDRPNFHMRKNAMVKKILIDADTKQTLGVVFVQNGVTYNVSAKREVVLSAGAINTPQLLMLSGIGPKDHLASIGIPVIKNLKVGYNLMDHVTAGGLMFVIDKPYSIRSEDVLQKTDLVAEYLSHHKGPLTLPGSCEVLTFSDLQNLNDPDGYPDIELLFASASLAAETTMIRNIGITNEIFDAVFKPIKDKHSFTVLPMLLRPKSSGRIVLKNSDYLAKPLIYPNYFAHHEDVRTLVEGIKLAINISLQPALQALGTKVHDIPLPGCAKLGFGTDEYWECYVRHFSFTIYHQSGTCKMGPKKDKRAVVDPRLRVYGIKGLRVIDASIMPDIPAAHTNAPVYMIAEKGSDMIKEDWRDDNFVRKRESVGNN